MASTFQGMAKQWVTRWLPGISICLCLGHRCCLSLPRSHGTLATCFSGVTFMVLSQNPDLRDSCCMCLSVAFLSPVPLCLSPSDFPDDPYLTSHIHMISRKGFWGSLLSRSFSYIQKPEGSKTLLYVCLSLRWGGNQVSPTPDHPKEFPSNYT